MSHNARLRGTLAAIAFTLIAVAGLATSAQASPSSPTVHAGVLGGSGSPGTNH